MGTKAGQTGIIIIVSPGVDQPLGVCQYLGAVPKKLETLLYLIGGIEAMTLFAAL